MKKNRKGEATGTAVGVLAGAALGAKIGAGIGIAGGGWAIAGTVPLGVICGAVAGLAGKWFGAKMDRRRTRMATSGAESRCDP